MVGTKVVKIAIQLVDCTIMRSCYPLTCWSMAEIGIWWARPGLPRKIVDTAESCDSLIPVVFLKFRFAGWTHDPVSPKTRFVPLFFLKNANKHDKKIVQITRIHKSELAIPLLCFLILIWPTIFMTIFHLSYVFH